MTTWSAVTWDTARAGGFAAYILLSVAVSVGLVLRNRWQTPKWPRLITNELHGYLSLLALVFIVVHVLAVLVDPFTHFGLAEVLVPFVSHYRPVWMGLGIVALYLLLAVWLSSRLRTRIRYEAWRRIHVLAYGVYIAATIHGLGTGSDTRSGWAPIVYASSVVVVGGLAARRLLVPAARGQRRRPVLAAVGGGLILLTATWAVAGPLAAHWGARAGGISGNRAVVSAQVGRRLSARSPERVWVRSGLRSARSSTAPSTFSRSTRPAASRSGSTARFEEIRAITSRSTSRASRWRTAASRWSEAASGWVPRQRCTTARSSDCGGRNSSPRCTPPGRTSASRSTSISLAPTAS